MRGFRDFLADRFTFGGSGSNGSGFVMIERVGAMRAAGGAGPGGFERVPPIGQSALGRFRMSVTM